MISLSIQLDDDAHRCLDDLARKMGCTKNECIQEAILMHYEEIIEEIDVVEERMTTPARHWTHSDIESGVDLAG